MNDKTHPASSSAEESSSDENSQVDSPLHEQIRRTLAQHGVHVRNQAAMVAELCDISPSQARRKLQGSAWLFEEIQALAEFCGCSIETLTQPMENHSSGLPQKASLLLDGMQLDCDIVVGRLMGPQELMAVPLQAMRHNSFWIAGTHQALFAMKSSSPRYTVERLTMSLPLNTGGIRVAILDDDPLAAESLCDWFINAGMRATAFTSSAALLGSHLLEFDAFVVDFILSSGQNSKSLIEQIRRLRPRAPIALLTGHLKDGTASEDDLANMMRNQKVMFFEKPIRPAMLVAALQNSLDRRETRT